MQQLQEIGFEVGGTAFGTNLPVPQEVARFERMLLEAEASNAPTSLVNAAELSASRISAPMQAALDGVAGVNQRYKNALEESLQTLSKVDATDPRAMVVALETAVHMATAEVQMQLAVKTAGASKEALNTLLRSQG
jgi:hydroxypyruvate isomerase